MSLSGKINIAIIIILLVLVFVNMLTFCGCGDSKEAENVATILGTVFNTEGAVLTGKKVELVGIYGTIGIAVRETTVDGKFSFINIPLGTYTITVTEQDANSTFIASKNVELVNQKETIEITITQGEQAPPTPTPTSTPEEGATPTPTP